MTNMKAMKPIILYGAQKKCNRSKSQNVKKKKKKKCKMYYSLLEKTNFKIELTTDTFQNKNQLKI